MRKQLTIGLLAVAVTFGLATTVTAQENQDSTVSVNVSDSVALDARPSSLSYGEDGSQGIEPGASVTQSDGGFEHIDIENIGSVPIQQVHAEATMTESNPFGDTGTNFNTGNFFTMSTATANSSYSLGDALSSGNTNMHYLNRVEYSETNPPEYIFTESNDIQIDGGTSFSASNTDVGRFRVGEAEYFWVLYSGQDSTSSSNSWVLRVGETPHTPNQLGTVDFRNPSNVDGSADYIEYNSSASSDAGTGDASYTVSRIDNVPLVSFDTGESSSFSGESLLDGDSTSGETDVNDTALSDVSGEVRRYNLFVRGLSNGAEIYRTSYNTALQSAQTDGSGNPEWRSSETNSGEQRAIYQTSSGGLQPGQNFPIDVGIQLPNGIDRDSIDTGTVTLVATESTSLS